MFDVVLNAPQDNALSIYLLKVNNRNNRTRCEIYSKSTKTPEQRHWRRSGVIIVNFETYFTPCSKVYIVNFQHVIAGCERWIFFTSTKQNHWSKISFLFSDQPISRSGSYKWKWFLVTKNKSYCYFKEIQSASLFWESLLIYVFNGQNIFETNWENFSIQLLKT